MVIKTKCFGEVEIDDEKVIEFETGLLGFEQYKKYTLIFDSTTEEQPIISWLQCVEEPALAQQQQLLQMQSRTQMRLLFHGILNWESN